MTPAPSVRLALMAPRFADAVQRLAEDPAIGATSMLPSPYPPDGAESFIRQTRARRARGEEYAFAVLAGGEVAGAVGLAGVKDGAAELGYWIGTPFQGRGLATAAARLALRFGFTRLRLTQVFAHCLKRNEASFRVLSRIGMRYVGDGRMPASKWPDEPVARFTLSRGEWRSLAARRVSRAAPRAARRRPA